GKRVLELPDVVFRLGDTYASDFSYAILLEPKWKSLLTLSEHGLFTVFGSVLRDLGWSRLADPPPPVHQVLQCWEVWRDGVDDLFHFVRLSVFLPGLGRDSVAHCLAGF